MGFCDTGPRGPFEIVASLVGLAVDSPQPVRSAVKTQPGEMSMKKLIIVVMAGLFACAGAYAADTKTEAKKTDAMKSDAMKTDAKTDAMNPQQNKMKTCQAEAGDKKLEGKARQDYVNNCLKAKPVKEKSKMAECNAKTKGMSKAEADKARSECMKA
jgi:psiF repeat-containing protein